MSLDLSPNPREHIGANHGPEIDPLEFTPATWEQRLIAHCAKAIALLLDMDEHARITRKRQLPKYLVARKLLFFCLQEERPFGDSAGEVRYGHLAQVEIQTALGIYRKTIGQDVQEVQRWCESSTELEAHIDTIRDAIDAHVANFGYHDRIMRLATDARALDRIRAAVDLLERK